MCFNSHIKSAWNRDYFTTILKEYWNQSTTSLTVEINNANTASYNQWDIITSRLWNSNTTDISNTVFSLEQNFFLLKISLKIRTVTVNTKCVSLWLRHWGRQRWLNDVMIVLRRRLMANCSHTCASVTNSIIWYWPMGGDAPWLRR